MIKRRCFTIGALIVITTFLVALAPLFISVALIASLLPAFRTAPHSLIFVYWFVICEWTGLACFAWVWTLYRHDPSYAALARHSILVGPGTF